MTSMPSAARTVGTLHAIDDSLGTVRMEDVYDTDIDDLWSALTDPLRLARWVAKVEGDLRLGGEIHAVFTSSWDGPGRIDVCETPHRLAVTMSPGEADETVIEANLTPADGRTRLVIEERGLPLDVLAAHGAGWQAHVEDLSAHLQGREPSDWHTRWTALVPTYKDLVVT
jgi:uncharacterized protein YndB with AHSA1/START domain